MRLGLICSTRSYLQKSCVPAGSQLIGPGAAARRRLALPKRAGENFADRATLPGAGGEEKPIGCICPDRQNRVALVATARSDSKFVI
jgi:hypothetical protein